MNRQTMNRQKTPQSKTNPPMAVPLPKGVTRMDADLGKIFHTRQQSSFSALFPKTTPPPKTNANQPARSTPKGAAKDSRQHKIALSMASTKSYVRVPQQRAPVKASSMVLLENTDQSEVDFPIDVVYTWVDGSDDEWLASRRKFEPTQQNIPVDSMLECRWRDFDELRHSVDSVNRFAPWVRNIFIISDYQRPYWFDENNPGKVKFVDHPDLFQDFSDHLPTFNSHSIESHLHQIDGLAEHFIYANDDTFFGNYVYPLDFFTEDGRFKVFLTTADMETEKSMQEFIRQQRQQPTSRPFVSSNSKLNPKINHAPKPAPKQEVAQEQINIVPYFTSQVVTNAVLDAVFGPSATPRKRLKHQMKPLRKSTFDWCWENETMQEQLFSTSCTRFRNLGDVDPTGLVSHTGLMINEAVPAGINSKYYGMTDTLDIKKMFYHLYKFRPCPKLYCINDSLITPPPDMLPTIQTGFEKFLPHKYL